jgi:hypothetical protein
MCSSFHASRNLAGILVCLDHPVAGLRNSLPPPEFRQWTRVLDLPGSLLLLGLPCLGTDCAAHVNLYLLEPSSYSCPTFLPPGHSGLAIRLPLESLIAPDIIAGKVSLLPGSLIGFAGMIPGLLITDPAQTMCIMRSIWMAGRRYHNFDQGSFTLVRGPPAVPFSRFLTNSTIAGRIRFAPILSAPRTKPVSISFSFGFRPLFAST